MRVRAPGARSVRLRGRQGDPAARAAFDAALPRIDYRPDTLVWDIDGGELHVAGAGGLDKVPYDALILATGAMDRVIPFPGWTLPGVFTLGGAQVALKYQGCAIGERPVFVGTGPLLYLVAYQYAKAGADVAAVLDAAPAPPWRVLQHLAAKPSTLAKGLYFVARLRAWGIPIVNEALPAAALGDASVGALRYRTKGREMEISCDSMGVGYGLTPQSQLADLAGCAFEFDAGARQWLPQTDARGRAQGCERVYLAGDGAGIAGADAAELTGERAALAALEDIGTSMPMARHALIERRLQRLARFRAGLDAAFPFPDRLARDMADDTILCRCEAIAAGELRAAARDAREINAAKALSRIGMGRCQGRVCGPAAAEVLAGALGVSPAQVGRLRGQPPVKPLPVGLLGA